MVMNMQNMQVFAFHKEGFQLHAPSQWSHLKENWNMFPKLNEILLVYITK